MRTYILKRLLLFIPVMIGASLLVFLMIRMVPGDVILLRFAESPNASPETMELMRAELGLDQPIYRQYFVWMWGIVHGDLGTSMWTSQPVMKELQKRAPVSAELAIFALVLTVVLGVTVGLVSAYYHETWIDHIVRLLSVGGLSVPGFWLGTLFLLFLALWFRWTPPIGYTPIYVDPLRNLQQFFLPALAIALHTSAVAARMTRSQMLEVLRQDYIRTARAKGLRELAVMFRHGVKNAVIPVVTITGNQFAYLLGGSVVMETVFSMPGIGRLTLESINQRDYTQLQGNILFMAMIIVVVNLLVDLTYAWLDPRVRYT